MSGRRRPSLRRIGPWRLGLLALLCAGGVVGAAYGAGSRDYASPPQIIERFHSRPDLFAPRVTVTTRGKTAPGYVFFAPKQLEAGFPGTSAQIQQGPEIMDDSGQIVWFAPVKGSMTRPKNARPHATDFRIQRYRGQTVLTWWEGLSMFGHGDGDFVIADSSYRRIATVRAQRGAQGDEHDFVITPQGTALVTVYKPVPGQDLSSVGGPENGTVLESGVQEIDIATGRLLFEWQSLGHVDLSESYSPPDKDPKRQYDYFHVNSVALEPNGNLLVSARNTHTLYEISRKTGKIVWRLGGRKSDFAMGEGTNFEWQHDARPHADGTITLFDNAAAPPMEKFTRILTLRVDRAAKKVALVRALSHPQKLLSGSQGNAQLLPDGHTFVGWGANPNLTEYDAQGRVVFDAHWTKGSDSYRGYRFRWVGKPLDRPAIAARGRGRVTAWVSWNGATEVRRWQLVAGASPTDLRPVTTVERTGFETEIRAQVPGPFLAVRALDAAGTVLRTSPTLHRTGSSWRLRRT